jgi:hypothetical protein
MSIYRGHRALLSDVQVRQVSDKPLAALPSPESPAHLRRAQPVLALLPRTAVWIGLLPARIRPNALAAQFPRIANLLCAVWADPLACRKYLAELLTDDRGGRKGFRTAMLREIQMLQAYHAQLHPRSDFNLDGVTQVGS